jgi:(Z)-2-((N-methylformamido)methylene)-5-hydroxybutyrolactone dehydrogenase
VSHLTDYRMLIGGERVAASSGAALKSTNPFTREPWATVPIATDADVDQAVRSGARALAGEWGRLPGIRRGEMIRRLGDLLDQDAHRMGRLESLDNGKVIRETESQMHFAARIYRFYADLADKISGEVIPLENQDILDYTTWEPVGVVALLTAWNSPMTILANKLAPALAAGNTVVIKPSDLASVTTLEFADLVAKVGFPAGVVNVVTGQAAVGEALVRHDLISKISLTGGVATGRLVGAIAGSRVIPATLELGGKSANIICHDADLSQAALGAVAGIFGAAGQTCIAGSRLLVHISVYEEVLEAVATLARRIRLGDPLDRATEMGPLANESQYERVLAMIKSARAEGARTVTGGDPATVAGGELGYFIQPTVFADVRNDMNVMREEIFGPVLCVMPFGSDEEAVAIANDSPFGLAAGIWTTHLARAHQMARALKAGTVWINTYRTASPQAPFGGVKLSGYGRERAGMASIADFSTVKNVMVNLATGVGDPFTLRS